MPPAVLPPPPAIRAQYEAWPYPRVPLLAGLPSTHPWQLHVDWLWDRSGNGPAPARPRIWIAGCGTFQPYAFALANPRADILASDLSERSLAIARRRCALRRQRHVAFAPVDLADPSGWPEGPFDLIECYGVLMNLPDPAATLHALAQRLAPRGVLRVMVYPQWSRTRIFQLQRLARLLGLHAGERDHPGRFRAAVRALPRAHPLRHAFATYADSRNDAGVVDAFLHAGDRGYTAAEFGDLVAAAGLQPAFWFHRPWAQPDVMAERLGFGDRSQTFVLGYLDLWQELRTNFVVCLRRRDAAPAAPGPERAHPLFASEAGGLRHRLRLSRLQWLGGRLPSRTDDGAVHVPPAAARALAHDLRGAPDDLRTRLRAQGLLLGGERTPSALPVHAPWPDEAAFRTAALALRRGPRAPNPLYAHLFAAWELDRRCPGLRLPSLDAQLARWLPWADPLEAPPIQWGLTPYRTLHRLPVNVREHLERAELPVADGWHEVRLRDDAAALGAARAFLAARGVRDAAPDAELRELWHLVFGHEALFLHLD